ncbi:hypothetical protein VPH35_048434 [Triticum aestivum]
MAAPNRWGGGGSGWKKTVIRRIEQDNALHVCFSKGRVGFFSKASDLAVLTGIQVAALTFSPDDNAFSFGHPSADTVVERFLAFTARMDRQEMPPPLVFAAGMEMEEMQMVIPQPLGFDDEMGMPPPLEITAGLETNVSFPFPY